MFLIAAGTYVGGVLVAQCNPGGCGGGAREGRAGKGAGEGEEEEGGGRKGGGGKRRRLRESATEGDDDLFVEIVLLEKNKGAIRKVEFSTDTDTGNGGEHTHRRKTGSPCRLAVTSTEEHVRILRRNLGSRRSKGPEKFKVETALKASEEEALLAGHFCPLLSGRQHVLIISEGGASELVLVDGSDPADSDARASALVNDKQTGAEVTSICGERHHFGLRNSANKLTQKKGRGSRLVALIRNPLLPHIWLGLHTNGAAILHNLEKKLPLATIVPPQSFVKKTAEIALDSLLVAAAWEATEGDLLALLARRTCAIIKLNQGTTASFTVSDELAKTETDADNRQLAFLSVAFESDIVAIGTNKGAITILYVSDADEKSDEKLGEKSEEKSKEVSELELNFWGLLDTGRAEKIRHIKIINGHLFALRADGMLCHWNLLPTPEETIATFSHAQLPLDRITSFDVRLDDIVTATD